jgi:hypothetical protein
VPTAAMAATVRVPAGIPGQLAAGSYEVDDSGAVHPHPPQP